MFEEQGKIDVKKPVPFYLPELKGSDWDDTTVEMMLDMANGLDSTEHDEAAQDTRTNPDRVYYQFGCSVGMFPWKEGMVKRDLWEILRGMKRKYPGHTKFEYNSINTVVMNRINEVIGGKPVSELASEMIWSKIGAEHDATIGISPQGYPLLFGFTACTLRDLARFGMAWTPSAKLLNPDPIISEAIQTKIRTTGVPEMYDKGYVGQELTRKFGETDIKNRYQWDAVFSDGDILKVCTAIHFYLSFPFVWCESVCTHCTMPSTSISLFVCFPSHNKRHSLGLLLSGY